MTHFTENGQPYSPGMAFAAGAAIMVGSYLAVAAVRGMVERNERKEMKR